MIRVMLDFRAAAPPDWNAQRCTQCVTHVLRESQITAATINLIFVDDATIHEVNRTYLQHDFPTDVITFPMSEQGEPLEGDILISVDTAARQAVEVGATTSEELLLYAVHGTLHLCGYDDIAPQDRACMRQAELQTLAAFGIQVRPAREGSDQASPESSSLAKGPEQTSSSPSHSAAKG